MEKKNASTANFSIHLDKVEWQSPKIPIIFNVDAEIHTDRYAIQSALGKQLYSPVLWRDCITRLANEGVTKAIEIGAGKVLCGLIKRIDERIKTFAFDQAEQLSQLQEFLSTEN